MSWKDDVADAVLIVNWCLCESGDDVTEQLRRVQSCLLEAYRQEINEPWNRFYVQKPVGGGNGTEKKKAKAAAVSSTPLPSQPYPAIQEEDEKAVAFLRKYQEHMQKYGNWQGKKSENGHSHEPEEGQ